MNFLGQVSSVSKIKILHHAVRTGHFVYLSLQSSEKVRAHSVTKSSHNMLLVGGYVDIHRSFLRSRDSFACCIYVTYGRYIADLRGLCVT
jgi:hypothetical protein